MKNVKWKISKRFLPAFVTGDVNNIDLADFEIPGD